jgi:hypothetical protein
MAQFRASSARFSEGQERVQKIATRWLCCEARANASRRPNSLITGKIQGISVRIPSPAALNPLRHEASLDEFPTSGTGNFLSRAGKGTALANAMVSVHFSQTSLRLADAICSRFSNLRMRRARWQASIDLGSAIARLSGGTSRGLEAQRLESTRVLRGARKPAQGVWQLAVEVQSRAPAPNVSCSTGVAR